MKNLGSYASAVLVVVFSLAGCAGNNSTSTIGYSAEGPLRPARQNRGERPIPFTGMFAAAARRDRHKSWFSPKFKELTRGRHELWASDFTAGDVYIFSLPSMTLAATLTGFDGPQGMCSTTSGNVWIANTYTFQIFEYNHNGTLLDTLSDPSGWPVGCAWDKRTGNLAVTNIVDFQYGHSGSQTQGAVLIYPGATGTPASYTDPDMFYYYNAGYDGRGNLYLDGEANEYPYYPFVLAELQRNFQSAFTINISGGTIYSPGSVQWYSGGPYLIVGDQECGGTLYPETSCLYEVSVTGSSGSILGSIPLESSTGAPACDVDQVVANGNKVYGGDLEYPPSYPYCSSPHAQSAWYRWGYPSGGFPQRSSQAFGDWPTNSPDGVALSKP